MVALFPRARGRRSLAVALLAIAIMPAPLFAQTMPRLDHVSICASDLDALSQSFTRAGLVADPAGLHVNAANRMAHIGFADQTYIELIGPARTGIFEGSPWNGLIAGNAGPCFWFVGTPDIAAEADRLKQAGIKVTAPNPGGRPRRDGASVAWLSAMAGDGSPGAVLPLMIEDRTPHSWRIRPSQSLAGGPLAGVRRVVIGVRDLDATIKLFRQAYGWRAPRRQHDPDFGQLAAFPGQPVILAAARDGWLAERVTRFGDGPVAYLLGTSDFNAARRKYRLVAGNRWFARRIGWFATLRAQGIRLGVLDR